MNELIETLLHEEESETLDFKAEQYNFINASNEEKAELLKDILAFANSWKRTNAFILVGVKDIKGEPAQVVGIKSSIDDASLQEFVNKKTNRPISFLYKEITYDNKKIGIIKIQFQERPFYLKKDFGKLQKEIVYIRRGTSTDIANPDEIAKMGAITAETEELDFDFFFYNHSEETKNKELYINNKILKKLDTNEIKKQLIEFNNPMETTELDIKYFIELANWLFRSEYYNPLYFGIRNNGIKTIFNLVARTRFYDMENKSIKIIDKDDLYLLRPRRKTDIEETTNPVNNSIPNIKLERNINKRTCDLFIYFDKIFPGELMFTKNIVLLGIDNPQKIDLKFEFVGENLSQKKDCLLSIHTKTKNEIMTWDDILNTNLCFINY